MDIQELNIEMRAYQHADDHREFAITIHDWSPPLGRDHAAEVVVGHESHKWGSDISIRTHSEKAETGLLMTLIVGCMDRISSGGLGLTLAQGLALKDAAERIATAPVDLIANDRTTPAPAGDPAANDSITLAQHAMEWDAWRAMCGELQRLGLDINEQDELTRLIREWGDRLADCRIENPNFGVGRGNS